MQRHICSFLFLFTIVFSGKAEQGAPVFINFTTRNGLAGNEAHRVMQDPEGYIWIATDFGLSRYDGYSFQNYGVADGMPENSVLNLFMDKKGKIWFNTFGASIGCIDKEKIFTIPMNAELRKRIASPIPSSFYTSNGDTLYYSVNNSSGYFRITEKEIEHILPETKDSGTSCFFKQMDAEHLFFYKNSGLDPRSDINLYLNNSLPPVNITPRTMSVRTFVTKDMYYVAVMNSLYHVSKENKVTFSTRPYMISCMKSIHGKFYLGVIKSGLEVYDHDPFSGAPVKYLDGLSVTDVIIDREGGLWATTLEHGVYYLPNPNIYEVAFSSMSLEKSVTRVISIPGKIFFGTNNGRLYEWNNETYTRYPIEMQSASKTVLSLAYNDQTGLLIVGSFINTLIIKNKKVILADNSAPAIFLRTDADKRIWGGNSDYLFYFKPDQLKFEKLTLARGALRVFDILPLENNLMLAATIDGLYHIHLDDTLYKVHEQDTLNTIRFTCLEKINNDIIIAGTRGQGIVVLSGENFFFINASNGIPDNCIQDILAEGSVIYAATNNGITRISFNPSDAHKYQVTNYSSNEGYFLNKVTSIARLDDNIYAGTEDGLFYFNPVKINYIEIAPDISINEVIINNKSAEPGPGFDLSYFQNNISIKYTGISPRSMGHITYLYRLLPDDRKWRNTLQREINFSSLTPGNYTFECLAQNAAGISSTSPVRLEFTIHEPWWKTWWFKSLLTSLTILGAYVIFRERFKRKYLIQQHELERVKSIEEERHRIAADMHDDLGTDLTNLVLTTQRMVQQNEVNRQELEKIGGRASDLIDKLSQIIWAMNPAYDYLPNLTAYISRFVAKQSELNNLTFRVSKSEEIPPARVGASLRRNIFLILKEALNNAIRHGHASDISLGFNYSGNTLIISLSDNGVGFSTSVHLNSGNGISNLKKRAASIGADLSIISSPGKGTEIIIVVKIESAG